MNKSNMSFFRLGQRNIWWNEIGLLFLILVVVLAISLFFSFRGFTEGLLESSEKDKINKALDEYNTEIEKISKEGIDKLGSPKAGLSQTDSIAIGPIINDASGKMTNSYKIGQVISMNSSNTDLLEILNEVQGKQYSALLKLLQAMPSDSKDNGFNTILKQHRKSPILGTDMNSTFAILSKYVKSM